MPSTGHDSTERRTRDMTTRYLVLALLLAGGFVGAGGWFVLFGALGLTIDGWWPRIWLLRQASGEAASTKVITYFVTGVVTDLGFAAVSYLCGWFVAALLEG